MWKHKISKVVGKIGKLLVSQAVENRNRMSMNLFSFGFSFPFQNKCIEYIEWRYGKKSVYGGVLVCYMLVLYPQRDELREEEQ